MAMHSHYWILPLSAALVAGCNSEPAAPTKPPSMQVSRLPRAENSTSDPNPPVAVADNLIVAPYQAWPFDEAEAKRRQEETAQVLSVKIETKNSLKMTLVLLPPGEFVMGSSKSAADTVRDFHYFAPFPATMVADEHPAHRVRLTRPFRVSAHEVTIANFRRFVEDTGYRTSAETGRNGVRGVIVGIGGDKQDRKYNWKNPGYPQRDDHPVVLVSVNDATEFCKWLSKNEGQRYRLPTEAEWEYACRAGTSTHYCTGDDPESVVAVANVADVSARENLTQIKKTINASDSYTYTAPVGSFKPNAFGLFDMHGNVAEWTQDRLDPNRNYYENSPADNPSGPANGNYRSMRGGDWFLAALMARSAARDYGTAVHSPFYGGFRIVQELE